MYQFCPIDTCGKKLFEEQTAIAEILSDMDAVIAALEGKLSKVREVKAGMMQELLIGTVRVGVRSFDNDFGDQDNLRRKKDNFMLTTHQANAPVPDELEWISNFLSFDRKITGDDIEHIRNFSILWNLFEGLVCNRHASVTALQNAVLHLQRQNKLQIDDYDKFLKYFAERYLQKGKVNNRFDRLNLRGGDKPELVEAVLKGDETAPENVLLALLIIVYRYRNNLFHGIKSIYDLPNQVENFRNANQLLMVFMEKWR